MKNKLTTAVVSKTAPPKGGRLEIFDEYLPGFALRITPKGARSFVVRARIRGQRLPVTLTIGDARTMTLAEARQGASDALRAMRAGKDPRPQKAAEVVLTFDALIDEWSRLHLSRRKPRYATETPAMIRRAFPALLKRPAAEISRANAVNALDKLALITPGAARNILAAARACFGWAQKRGKVPANPFAELPGAPVGAIRERVLSDTEIVEIWTAAGTLPYPFGPFFKLVMLTLQRRDEVAGMRWSEIISDDTTLWRIPGPRMKRGRPHDVHLSEPARAVLQSLPRLKGCDLVFTTGRRRRAGLEPAPISGFSKAKRYLDAAIANARTAAGEMPGWVVHDFRRTGVSTLAALGFDSIVADKLLAHQPAKLLGVAAIYQRHDFARERAAALDAWAAHVTGQKLDNVTPMPARSAAR